MAVAFDTLGFANRLKKAGVNSEQAEAQSEALADALSLVIDNQLATKQDIVRLENATKADIAQLESATKAEIARLESATRAEITRLENTTKTEIAQLENTTKTEIAQLENTTKVEIARLEKDIYAVEMRLTVRMGGMLVASVGLISTLMVILHLH